jgi:circadian clock protein KaiC
MTMRKIHPSAEGHPPPSHRPVVKSPTGISGFDEITRGGLPEGRLSVLIGSAGSGKTVFALQTAVNRLVTKGEACIFVAFEESVDRILTNAATFEWGASLAHTPGLRFVDARLPVDTVVSGVFDLSALLAGLTVVKEEVDARFIIFDAVDMLLSGLRNEWLESREMARLEDWIRSSALTAILTVKTFGRGESDQRRTDLLQYMADCVVVLSRSLSDTESSRSLCVQKYRGADFHANPVPMVITAAGSEVVALRTDRNDYPVFSERVSTGIARLDGLINGGYRRGSSILISGSPGTSKTSLAASFAASACSRGERALFISFDESGAQIIENMESIGANLQTFVDEGLLLIASFISTGATPEAHFVRARDLIRSHRPSCLVIDPISALLKSRYPFSREIVEALLDFAKSQGITVLCTSLLDSVSGDAEMSASHVSTIADTWIQVSYVARDGERNRALTIIKSRGTAHSNQVRELTLGFEGIDLVDVYVAEGEVLMGSARLQKEADIAGQQTLAVAESRLRQMALEAEFTALDQQVMTATITRDLKQKEIDFLASTTRARAAQSRVTAGRRLDLRRSTAEAALATTDGHAGVS